MSMLLNKFNEVPSVIINILYDRRSRDELNSMKEDFIDKYSSIQVDNKIYCKDKFYQLAVFSPLSDRKVLQFVDAAIINDKVIKNRYGYID